MKTQFCTIAISTLLSLGIAAAAPLPHMGQDQGAQPRQWAGHGQMDPNQQLEHLTKKLNLTADQQNQILPILTGRQQAMQGIRSDSSPSQEDRHAKMKAAREDSDSKIRAVLTDDQKKTYDQMEQQMRERRRERQGNNAGSPQ